MTKNFKLEEFVRSDTADKLKIDNTPSDAVKRNILRLCEEVLQPLRDGYEKPIIITSGYRCQKLNQAVNGSKNSDHLTGCAVDITAVNKADNKDLFHFVQLFELPFNQLIWEKGNDSYPDWIHVSLLPKGNKRQILRL